MAKRDYKQYRRMRLIQQGFLPFEADYYSRFPLKQPGMRRLARFRDKQIRQAREAGITPTEMPTYIQDSYRAKGYVSKQGKPDVEIYNSELFYELEKPSYQRKQLFIIPDRYPIFIKLARAKFNVEDAGRLTDSIPPEELNERMKMYRALRKAHYSSYEAAYIVTAQTPPDKKNKTRLQQLDLKQDAWQTAMKERDNWFQRIVKSFVDRGMTAQQAVRAAMKRIDDWYRKDKTRTPFDEIEDISPTGPPKPKIDFKDALKKRREIKQKKDKAPWRTTKR